MSFPLIGNEKIRLSIENSLEAHRLPHAIIIDGEIGLGKHTLAGFLSRAAVCSGETIPCGECKNCIMSVHPDIITISPENKKKSIGVDQIRELKTEAYIKPNTSFSKVFIIDPADSMNEQAQNALLKVLEEPPKNTYFILIAENKAYFLDTIVSRCVVLTLNSPKTSECAEYISSLGNYSEEEILNALQNSGNNIGKALDILKGKGDTKTSIAAEKFIEYSLKGDQWNALLTLTPFEKSRPETAQLFKCIKLYINSKIKQNPKSKRSADFFKLYTKLQELEYSLVTNINLSLLFANLTSEAKKFIG